MEKLVQIIQTLPFQERAYTDRNDQRQTFASRGFVLSDGVDNFYAEMQGDYARSMKDFQPDPSIIHGVQMQISCRNFQDKDGNTRYTNEIRITKMS